MCDKTYQIVKSLIYVIAFLLLIFVFIFAVNIEDPVRAGKTLFNGAIFVTAFFIIMGLIVLKSQKSSNM